MTTMAKNGVWFGLIVIFAMALPAVGQDSKAPVLVVASKTVDMQVSVDLPKTFKTDDTTSWQLVELGGDEKSFPVDLVPAVKEDGTPDAKRQRVVATIPGTAKASKDQRRFELRPAEAKAKKNFKLVELSPASVEIRQSDRPVFVYNHDTITNEKVPKKDRRRRRACYVHPIYGLDGEVLTDDFPRDHYHHHGLFWAWPHVQIDGKVYDLWTGKGIQLRPVRPLGRYAGDHEATIGYENGWFVGKRKVMTERVWLTAHKANDTARAIDVAVTWTPVDRPITLWGADRKSYGGMTLRFAVPRKKKGSITVPKGVTKRDLAVKRLKWVDLVYPFGGEGSTPSGATLMVSKTHPDYPPTWLTRHYGPQCVGYPGVEQKEFEPGKPFTLKYRVWVHKGPGNLETFKKAYDAYAAGEEVHWE